MLNRLIWLLSFRLGGIVFYGGFNGSRSLGGSGVMTDIRLVCSVISSIMNMHVFSV